MSFDLIRIMYFDDVCAPPNVKIHSKIRWYVLTFKFWNDDEDIVWLNDNVSWIHMQKIDVNVFDAFVKWHMCACSYRWWANVKPKPITVNKSGDYVVHGSFGQTTHSIIAHTQWMRPMPQNSFESDINKIILRYALKMNPAFVGI